MAMLAEGVERVDGVEAMTKRIFIGGLDPSITLADLSSRFKSFGLITDLKLNSKYTDTAFAHLTIKITPLQFLKFVKIYNNTKWKSHYLRIEESKIHYIDKLNAEIRLVPRTSETLDTIDTIDTVDTVDNIEINGVFKDGSVKKKYTKSQMKRKRYTHAENMTCTPREGWVKCRYNRYIPKFKTRIGNREKVVDQSQFNNYTKFSSLSIPCVKIADLNFGNAYALPLECRAHLDFESQDGSAHDDINFEGPDGLILEGQDGLTQDNMIQEGRDDLARDGMSITSEKFRKRSGNWTDQELIDCKAARREAIEAGIHARDLLSRELYSSGGSKKQYFRELGIKEELAVERAAVEKIIVSVIKTSATTGTISGTIGNRDANGTIVNTRGINSNGVLDFTLQDSSHVIQGEIDEIEDGEGDGFKSKSVTLDDLGGIYDSD